MAFDGANCWHKYFLPIVNCIFGKGWPEKLELLGWSESFKGRVAVPKQMNFQKNSKRPLILPPSFLGTYVAFFLENLRKKPYIKVQNLQHKFLDWKWPLPRPLWNFSKKSSLLVPWPVPNRAIKMRNKDVTVRRKGRGGGDGGGGQEGQGREREEDEYKGEEEGMGLFQMVAACLG